MGDNEGAPSSSHIPTPKHLEILESVRDPDVRNVAYKVFDSNDLLDQNKRANADFSVGVAKAIDRLITVRVREANRITIESPQETGQ